MGNAQKQLSHQNYRKIWDKTVGSDGSSSSHASSSAGTGGGGGGGGEIYVTDEFAPILIKKLAKHIGLEGFSLNKINDQLSILFEAADEDKTHKLSSTHFKIVLYLLSKHFRLDNIFEVSFLNDSIITSENISQQFKQVLSQDCRSQIVPLLEKIWTVEYPRQHEVPPPGSSSWLTVGFLSEHPSSEFEDTGIIGVICLSSLLDQQDLYFFLKKAMMDRKMIFVTTTMSILSILFRLMGWSVTGVTRIPSGLPLTFKRLSETLFHIQNAPVTLDTVYKNINKIFFLLLCLSLHLWEKALNYKDTIELFDCVSKLFEEVLKGIPDQSSLDGYLFDHFGLVPLFEQEPMLNLWMPGIVKHVPYTPDIVVLNEINKLLADRGTDFSNVSVYCLRDNKLLQASELKVELVDFRFRNLWVFPKGIKPHRALSLKVYQPTEDFFKPRTPVPISFTTVTAAVSGTALAASVTAPIVLSSVPSQRDLKRLSDTSDNSQTQTRPKKKSSSKKRKKKVMDAATTTPEQPITPSSSSTPVVMGEENKTISKTAAQTVIGGGNTFTVILDCDEIKTIVYNPDKTLYEVLESICISRGLCMDDYEVRNAKDDTLIKWHPKMKLPVLNTSSIKFVKKTENSSLKDMAAPTPIGNVKVIVSEGRGLLAIDAKKSNPYVKIFFDGIRSSDHLWKSTVKEKTVNPNWESDSMISNIYHLPANINIEVWSSDPVGDQFIGKTDLCFEERDCVSVNGVWIALEPKDHSDRVKKRGEIKISYRITFENQLSPPNHDVVSCASSTPNSASGPSSRVSSRTHVYKTFSI